VSNERMFVSVKLESIWTEVVKASLSGGIEENHENSWSR